MRLSKWLDRFATHPNLKMVWFDVKVSSDRVQSFASELIRLLPTSTSSTFYNLIFEKCTIHNLLFVP